MEPGDRWAFTSRLGNRSTYVIEEITRDPWVRLTNEQNGKTAWASPNTMRWEQRPGQGVWEPLEVAA